MATIGAKNLSTHLQKFINDCLVEKNYQFVPREKFSAAKILEQQIYTQKYNVGNSIYNTQLYCDFILYHPNKHPNCLIIESKWQQTGGSVDEKFPYFVLNIQQEHHNKTVIVLDGGGYKKKAEIWLKSQCGNNILAVLNMGEFQKWVNNGNI